MSKTKQKHPPRAIVAHWGGARGGGMSAATLELPKSATQEQRVAVLPARDIRMASLNLLGHVADCLDLLLRGLSGEHPLIEAISSCARATEIYDYLLTKFPSADRWWNFARDCGAFGGEAAARLGLNPLAGLDAQPLFVQLEMHAICATVPAFHARITLAQTMAANAVTRAAQEAKRQGAAPPPTGGLIREQVAGFAERSHVNEKVGDDD